MKLKIFAIVAVLLYTFSALAQKVRILSPNQRIGFALFNLQNGDAGDWYIKVFYNNNWKVSEAIPRIDLGLSRSDQDFSVQYLVIDKASSVDVKLLRRGGFVASLIPVSN